MTQEDIKTMQNIYAQEIMDAYHNALKSVLGDAAQVYGKSDQLDEEFKEFIEKNEQLNTLLKMYSLHDVMERRRLANATVRMFLMSKLFAKADA